LALLSSMVVACLSLSTLEPRISRNLEDAMRARCSAVGDTFTVTIRNESVSGDNTITGVAVDGGGATPDTHNVVTAVGAVSTATRTITVVAGRATIPPPNAAMSLPGIQADVAFTGASFDVWGTDTNLDGTAGAAAAVCGIAVSATYPTADPGANEAPVEQNLD
jgi:hypothetical protein